MTEGLVESRSAALERLEREGAPPFTPVCPECGHPWQMKRDVGRVSAPRFLCFYCRFEETTADPIYCPCVQTRYIAEPLGRLLDRETRAGMGVPP